MYADFLKLKKKDTLQTDILLRHGEINSHSETGSGGRFCELEIKGGECGTKKKYFIISIMIFKPYTIIACFKILRKIFDPKGSHSKSQTSAEFDKGYQFCIIT